MKTVILAGGLGTRISEESHLKPKPMIEIGGQPILWHIMKNYAAQGFNDFVVCCGYKAYVIKEYFADYFLHNCDVTFDFKDGRNTMEVHANNTDPWRVTLVDTGLNTMTGGRVKRVQSYIGNEPFMLTYGDGVADVDLKGLLKFHNAHGKAATITTVQPEGRFGVLDMNNDQILAFREKSQTDVSWINGGFMVMTPEIFDRISDDTTILEREPLESFAQDGQLMAYKHQGFWQCMDTQRDKQRLEILWESGRAPWRNW